MHVIVNRVHGGITRTQMPEPEVGELLGRLARDLRVGKVRWFHVASAGAETPNLQVVESVLDPQPFVVDFEDTNSQESRYYETEDASIVAAEEADAAGVTATRRSATLAEQIVHLRGEWCVVQAGSDESFIGMPRGLDGDDERFTTRRHTGMEMFVALDEVVSIRKVHQIDE